MAPHRKTPQSSQGDAPDITKAIEEMLAAMTQESMTMMQHTKHRCSDIQHCLSSNSL